VTVAENIDPDGDGSQFAWAENVGWINAEPSGDGGPGVQVDDFELTGYMWGENIGWVSMSCKNDSTCGTTAYGVVNDGQGVLSGYAWGENVGWIDFAPTTAGVLIDVSTGNFSGHAWGENIGWIAFAASGEHPCKIKTSWNCDPAPPAPSGSAWLTVGSSGADTELSWGALAGATGYDVVAGSLSALRSSGGDYSLATDDCLANNHTATSLTVSDLLPAGGGLWFLVRSDNCGGAGTCDSGGVGQVDGRDAAIGSSGNDCP